ncbi:hypothetical protein ACQFX9_21535 [Aliinostoc sp. HNIBRCY26]|uniref:hypothetical protein n=1 Tax=Aliinostoc sp. HNIBRCY26 TaxID=3418997 RepID=UPI003D06DED9
MYNELKDKITFLSTQVSQEVDSVNELEVKSNNTNKFTFKALEIDNALKSKKESIVRCKLKANQVEKTISTMKDIQDLISKEQKDELEKKQFYLRDKLEELERSYNETYKNLRDNLWIQALDFINQILGNIKEISNSVLQWQFSEIVEKHFLPSFLRKLLPFSRS